MTPWLLVLLLAWGGLLFGGYFFGRPSAVGERRMPRWSRLASSLVLVIAAWSLFALASDGPATTFALLIAVGMTLGFAGDLFMAKLIPVRQHVLGGMGAFALGHIAYIAAGLRLGEMPGLNAVGVRIGAWLAWLLIGVLGWWFLIYRGQRLTALHWAALPYALLLASTAGVATGLALQDLRFLPFAVGAALFLFSDMMIATSLFAERLLRSLAVDERSLRSIAIDDLIWLTYGPGQMLIVFTSLLAPPLT